MFTGIYEFLRRENGTSGLGAKVLCQLRPFFHCQDLDAWRQMIHTAQTALCAEYQGHWQ
jgi:hypothetical protein